MGDFKSQGAAVCTPRQQQRQQQQQLLQVEEKADMGVIGNEEKHVRTFRDKSHGRQPCTPYQEGCLVGLKLRGIIAACILLLEN